MPERPANSEQNRRRTNQDIHVSRATCCRKPCGERARTTAVNKRHANSDTFLRGCLKDLQIASRIGDGRIKTSMSRGPPAAENLAKSEPEPRPSINDLQISTRSCADA